jgi:hypothetical protein
MILVRAAKKSSSSNILLALAVAAFTGEETCLMKISPLINVIVRVRTNARVIHLTDILPSGSPVYLQPQPHNAAACLTAAGGG